MPKTHINSEDPNLEELSSDELDVVQGGADDSYKVKVKFPWLKSGAESKEINESGGEPTATNLGRESTIES